LTTIKCPHCQTRYRIGLFPIQATGRQSLESTQPFFSNNLLGRTREFFWFMAGNRPIKQTGKLIVESIIKTSKHQTLINQCEIPASTRELRSLYNVYIRLGMKWSRSNSNSRGVTQPAHLKIQKAFLALMFLERVNATSYTLTDAGYRFLRHFGDT